MFSQRSPFQEFLYSCILVHKSGFYNKFKKGLIIDGNNTNNNVNTSNDNNQQGGDQFRSLFEGFLEIREGYVFMDLASTINKNTGRNIDKNKFVVDKINENFELSPRGIREMLNLNKPIYEKTAAYGHFGRTPDDSGSFSWEKTDKSSLFKL